MGKKSSKSFLSVQVPVTHCAKCPEAKASTPHSPYSGIRRGPADQAVVDGAGEVELPEHLARLGLRRDVEVRLEVPGSEGIVGTSCKPQ